MSHAVPIHAPSMVYVQAVPRKRGEARADRKRKKKRIYATFSIRIHSMDDSVNFHSNNRLKGRCYQIFIKRIDSTIFFKKNLFFVIFGTENRNQKNSRF